MTTRNRWRLTALLVVIPGMLIALYSWLRLDQLRGCIYRQRMSPEVCHAITNEGTAQRWFLYGLALFFVGGIINRIGEKYYGTKRIDFTPMKPAYLLHDELEEQEKRRKLS